MTYSTSATRWNHGIQGHREGCAEGNAAPGAGLEGAPRVSKRSTELLFYGIRLVCFLEKSLFIDVFGALYHRRVATGTLLVIIILLACGLHSQSASSFQTNDLDNNKH